MKGVFYSLTILIVGLVLLSLVVIISQKNLDDQKSITRIVVANRMQDEITYISRELISIINLFNITVVVDGQTVSITEYLPFPNKNRFETDLTNWKTFTESNSDFNLTVDVTDISNTLPLIINNQVEYKHTNGVSGNKITVENASPVLSYSLNMEIHADGNISVKWDDKESGIQRFSLSITTNNDSFSDSWMLDFSKGNELEIDIDPGSGHSSKIETQVGKGNDKGFFKVDNKDKLPMILTTNITLNTTSVTVNFPNSIINIQSPQYNISRITTAIIDSS